MNDQAHAFETALPQSAALGGSTTAHIWREFAIDLPLSLSSLPSKVATDMLNFASRRLHAQAEHLGSLGQCRTFADITRLQTDLATRAVAEYQEEVVSELGNAKRAVTGERPPA